MKKVKKKRYKPIYLVKIYQASKQGFTNAEIASVLGVSEVTFHKWKTQRPEIRDAIKKGRKGEKSFAQGKHKKKVGVEQFHNYVYDHLPKNLQQLWDKIVVAGSSPNGLVRVEALLKDQGKKMRQHLFLHSLVSSNFKPSQALKRLAMTKAELDSWKTDPEFSKLLEEIEWHKDNFFEDAFLDLIAEREKTAVVHAAKTKLAHRGYGNRTVVENTGEVNHNHSFDTMISQLPLEDRIKILEAVKQAKLNGQQKLPARMAEVVVNGGESE